MLPRISRITAAIRDNLCNPWQATSYQSVREKSIMDHLQIISTKDGSHSLLHTALQETYHSKHGALCESRHVFIEAGLNFFVEENHGKIVRVLEVGFGTGLNTILSLIHARNGNYQIYYESWEKDPLPMEVVELLNYGKLLDDSMGFNAIHKAPWDVEEKINSSFILKKVHGDITRDTLSPSFDIIYYDAFAPDKQPEMWSKEVLKRVTDMLSLGGALVTYCAKGQLKRDLSSLGLLVETLPGPPGKREMTRARK